MFYNRTIKKEYTLQIRQHNISHTNIIVIKDVIISKKARKEEIVSEGIVETTAPVEIARVLSIVNLAGRYN